MKKYLYCSIFLFVFLMTQNAIAQFKDYKLKFGLQGSYLDVANEFTEDKYNPSLLFRPHLGFQMSKVFDVDFGLGYGWNQGEDYGGNKYYTSFIPLDVRLILSPINSDKVNPYAYLGLGAAYWDLSTKPINPPPVAGQKTNGVTGLGEAGLGIEIALNKNWAIDVTAGYNVFSSDNINGVATKLQDKFLHNYDRYINLGIGLTYVVGTCHTDEDMDGLEQCTEDSIGTDPKNPDTDGDGLKDGEEYLTYKTNPLKADTDGDGLMDGEEVNVYHTNPLNVDTDGDGLSDYDEVHTYKTDPNKQDTDGDGLKDGEEVNTYKTDPLKADTDGDGLSDKQEVIEFATNPLMVDTDGDGLTDGQEVNTYKTNPKVKDTDKGGIDDGIEVKRGTDPLDPFDDFPKMEEGIKVHILFEVNKSEIRPPYFGDLDRALQYMLKHPERKFEIHGYTSTEGTVKKNQKLSDNRSQAVVDWFISRGVASDRLKAVGHGETEPIMVNGKEDRELSRRIILIMLK